MCLPVYPLVLLLFINSIIIQLNAQFIRVVGGTPTKIENYPVVAQMLLDPWGDGRYSQYCAGVILTTRHVVSTAHCYQYNYENKKNYTHVNFWRIRVGSSFRNRGGVLHKIKNIIPHKNFNKYYYTNDIAVVVVAKPFAFGTTVRQATLPKYKTETKPNSMCIVVGWGAKEVNGPQPDQIQHVIMSTIDHQICAFRYSMIGAVIADSMMCAGHLDVGGIDGCFGDSGGPLIYKGLVVGLVSFGFACGDRYYPGVYTKISHYTNWIVKTVSNNK